MSPKRKTRDVKMRSCRKNKTKETTPINSPPKKTKPKRRIIEKIPKEKKFPSASTASCVPTEENKKAEEEDPIRTRLKKYISNAYKLSPEYENQKKETFKVFSITLFHDRPSPEEDNDPKGKGNFPRVSNTSEPGHSSGCNLNPAVVNLPKEINKCQKVPGVPTFESVFDTSGYRWKIWDISDSVSSEKAVNNNFIDESPTEGQDSSSVQSTG